MLKQSPAGEGLKALGFQDMVILGTKGRLTSQYYSVDVVFIV